MSSKYDIYKEDIKRDYAKGNITIGEINKKYNIKSHSYVSNLLKEEKRSRQEIAQLTVKSHKSYRHTKETKEKLREIRLKYMREHPEDTAWRKRNEPSYPEKCFIDFLKKNKYDKNFLIEREYCVFPFFIDFAFVDLKIAIEIDGSQHLEKKRKDKDNAKDNLLLSQGWKILRISENIVKSDWNTIKEKLDLLLSDNDIVYKKIGIIKHISPIKKEIRDKYGRTEKQNSYSINNRKVKNRPSSEDLINLLKTYKSFSKVSKMFNVCDKTIVKWCKWYRLPTHIKNYK